MIKKLIFQAIKFIGLSGIGWILDFLTFTILCSFFDDVVFDNFLSSWIGVTFVFVFATRTVFQNGSKISLRWKYCIYIIYQIILIYFISKLLGLVNQFILKNIEIDLILGFSEIVSKIAVTPITMVLNFFVMKGVIEKL